MLGFPGWLHSCMWLQTESAAPLPANRSIYQLLPMASLLSLQRFHITWRHILRAGTIIWPCRRGSLDLHCWTPQAHRGHLWPWLQYIVFRWRRSQQPLQDLRLEGKGRPHLCLHPLTLMVLVHHQGRAHAWAYACVFEQGHVGVHKHTTHKHKRMILRLLICLCTLLHISFSISFLSSALSQRASACVKPSKQFPPTPKKINF